MASKAELEKHLRTLDVHESVTPDSVTPAELKRAYREMVQVWHPDRFSHNDSLKQRAERKMREINAAHDALRDALGERNRRAAKSQPEPRHQPTDSTTTQYRTSPEAPHTSQGAEWSGFRDAWADLSEKSHDSQTHIAAAKQISAATILANRSGYPLPLPAVEVAGFTGREGRVRLRSLALQFESAVQCWTRLSAEEKRIVAGRARERFPNGFMTYRGVADILDQAHAVKEAPSHPRPNGGPSVEQGAPASGKALDKASPRHAKLDHSAIGSSIASLKWTPNTIAYVSAASVILFTVWAQSSLCGAAVIGMFSNPWVGGAPGGLAVMWSASMAALLAVPTVWLTGHWLSPSTDVERAVAESPKDTDSPGDHETSPAGCMVLAAAVPVLPAALNTFVLFMDRKRYIYPGPGPDSREFADWEWMWSLLSKGSIAPALLLAIATLVWLGTSRQSR